MLKLCNTYVDVVLQFVEQQAVYNETDSIIVCAILSGVTERTVTSQVTAQDITATGVEMFVLDNTFSFKFRTRW